MSNKIPADPNLATAQGPTDPTIAALLSKVTETATTGTTTTATVAGTPVVINLNPPADPPISLRRLVIFHELQGNTIVKRVGLVIHVWSKTSGCVNLVVWDERGETGLRQSVCPVESAEARASDSGPRSPFAGVANRWSYSEEV